MAARNPAVDNYILKAAPFAQPVLHYLRELVHKVCPAVEEKLKWGMPSFEYKGVMCGFASFKQHCTFGFWKAAIMKDAAVLTGKESRTAMGSLGRITSLKDLPKDAVLTRWIKEAMKLNDENIKVPRAIVGKHPKKDLLIPAYFTAALKKNAAARHTFENFSPSNKREYVEWITDAKTDGTRDKRLAQAIEWMAEGKIRHWKYMRK